ncbi:MAG: hypothetical protein WA990_15460 [Rubrobacteraceae bacterium]
MSRGIQQAGHPAPLGDLASGAFFLLEQPVGPRAIEALSLSLESTGLSGSYVTWTSTGFLPEEILASEPTVLVAVGPGAAREIDGLGYPLARHPFSEATPGAWFNWTRGTSGLLLPSLAKALEDTDAKRSFWRAFLSLRGTTTSSR